MVDVTAMDEQDLELVERLIREHEEKTASPRARTILVQWQDFAAALSEGGANGCGGSRGRGAGGVSADAGGAGAGPKERVEGSLVASLPRDDSEARSRRESS